MRRNEHSVRVIDSLSERKYIRGLLEVAAADQPVILVGSWARGTVISRWSDVDVLLVGDVAHPRPHPKVQVIVLRPSELRRRIEEGDDFAQWALRFGVPLAGRRLWNQIREELLPQAPWPKSDRKMTQARKKLAAAEILLQMGDVPAAEEEVRFALSHLARAVLLSHHVFPMSRPELSNQLEEVGDKGSADMMRRANSSRPMTRREVGLAIHFLQSRLQTPQIT